MNMFKYIFVSGVVLMESTAMAVSLSGSSAMNITSDTAANAKSIAMNEARRHIIRDVVGQYANFEQLAVALSETQNSELMNLVASVSIDGERLSDTTYDAKINMTLDTAAVQNWLTQHGVQNWLPSNVDENMVSVTVTFNNAIEDWIELNTIMRNNSIDSVTDSLVGNKMSFLIPISRKTAFMAALRSAGWRYVSQNDSLKIQK